MMKKLAGTTKTVRLQNPLGKQGRGIQVIERQTMGSNSTWSVAINNCIQGNFDTEDLAIERYNVLLIGFLNDHKGWTIIEAK